MCAPCVLRRLRSGVSLLGLRSPSCVLPALKPMGVFTEREGEEGGMEGGEVGGESPHAGNEVRHRVCMPRDVGGHLVSLSLLHTNTSVPVFEALDFFFHMVFPKTSSNFQSSSVQILI